MEYLLGIDLGGSSVKFVAVTPEGRILDRRNLEFKDDDRMDWAAKILDLLDETTAAHGTSPQYIGLSAPGLAAADGKSISHMPGRLQGLERLNWTLHLQQPRAVSVLNDAHAALLGEVWLGAAQGLENVLMLTLGTGVGGAAMVDGRLLRGHIGRAGHFGHVCLDPQGPPDVCRMPGSLEVAIGNCTVHDRSSGRFRTTHDLVRAAESGDADARRVWLKSVRELGCAVGSMINVMDPAAVVIGGGIARSGRALFDPLQEVLDEVEWRPGGHTVPVLPAQLGEFAGAYGAARNAWLVAGK